MALIRTDSITHRGRCPGGCALLLIVTAWWMPAQAQAPLYVSDEVFIVLHAGPGTSYRWLGRLTPGTELSPGGDDEAEYGDENVDDEWLQVTTTRGTSGWVRREFLSADKPAQARLPELQQRLQALTGRNAELEEELRSARASGAELAERAEDTGATLASTQAELAQLKAISGRAVQLDEDNRELVQTVETLRTEVDVLQADNQRLQENLRSSAFIDGALAVLLGVLITLAVPRLWPKRRRSSSWA